MSDKLPRGLRNNNPGNIDKGEPWQGLSQDQPDRRFCTFSSLAYGCRALIKLLQTYHNKRGLNTVQEIINRWAPSFENDTSAYVTAVAKDLGVEPNTPLDFTKETYINLGKAIARHENGKIADSYISEETWLYAARLAGL